VTPTDTRIDPNEALLEQASAELSGPGKYQHKWPASWPSPEPVVVLN
jgi:hypothetical protein